MEVVKLTVERYWYNEKRKWVLWSDELLEISFAQVVYHPVLLVRNRISHLILSQFDISGRGWVFVFLRYCFPTVWLTTSSRPRSALVRLSWCTLSYGTSTDRDTNVKLGRYCFCRERGTVKSYQESGIFLSEAVFISTILNWFRHLGSRGCVLSNPQKR